MNARMERTQAVKARFEQMPAETKRRKYRRTLWGVVFVAIGLTMHLRWPDLHDAVSFAMFGVGIITLSGEVVLQPVRLMVAVFADVMGAIGGRERHRHRDAPSDGTPLL